MEVFPLFRCISEKEIHEKHMGKNTLLPVSTGQSQCCLEVQKNFQFICYMFCFFIHVVILENGGSQISRDHSKPAENKSDYMLQCHNLAVQDFPRAVRLIFRHLTYSPTNLFANYEL